MSKKKRKSFMDVTVTEFMTGRYGQDEVSKVLIIGAMVLMVCTLLIQSYLGLWQLAKVLYIVALILLGFGYYRMGSKNIKRRTAEREAYLKLIAPFSAKARKKLEKDETVKKYANFEAYTELGEDGVTVYKCYRCRKCDVVVRYEAGGGIVKVVCPECGTNLVDRL
jgi:hypothetical protein